MQYPAIILNLPGWLEKFSADKVSAYKNVDEQMALVVAMAQENITQRTGGPFAAAVFSAAGNLIAPGVNLVTTERCSVFHAEIVALMFAQKILGRFDLSDGGRERYSLVSSVEPCAMCYGAIPWSGITQLIYGARDADARAVGFDEGDKPKQWRAALEKRGINVTRDVMRREARQVLQSYAQLGGDIYNSGCC